MYNLFEDDSLKKVELEDGFFVEVKESMGYKEFKDLFEGNNQSDLDFLVKVIENWNFKTKDGSDVPCDESNIRKLSSKVVAPLAGELIKIYMPEKKILLTSTKK